MNDPGSVHTALPRRAVCNRCLRPERTCLCAFVVPTANEVSVLVLQHPLEEAQAKGSARLLQLSLQRCILMVGETWDAPVLQQVLDAPGPDGQALSNVLLYPESNPETHTTAHQARAVSPNHPLEPFEPSAPAAHLRLIVLDGTWRKSLKMLHLNPALARLPRLALSAQAPSRYLIRKAHRPDQLSTLEATCLALGQLENQTARYVLLRQAFDRFVGAQRTFSA